MIDNPLPNQVMEERDLAHLSDLFNQTCFDHGLEIAKHYKVHSDLHEYFAKWYYDHMSQNSDLFDPCFFVLDSDYIVDWWENESYLYDDFNSPYMEIKND